MDILSKTLKEVKGVSGITYRIKEHKGKGSDPTRPELFYEVEWEEQDELKSSWVHSKKYLLNLDEVDDFIQELEVQKKCW